MTTLSARTAPSVVRRPSSARPLAVAAGVVAVTAILVASAWLRWSGQLPLGSDNDEYLLVAGQLRWFEPPTVAGVEGTKYPLGYPALLAVIGALGLPVAQTAMVINVLAIALTAAAAAQTVRVLRLGGLATFAAAAYVAAAPALWSSAYSVMPDVLLVLVVATTVGHLARTRTGADVVLLGVLVAIAAALKSVGLLVGFGLAAGLLFVPRLRLWAWVPALAGAAVTAATMAIVGRYPEHTTGYAATFWLSDPYDASQGTVSAGDAARRITTRAGLWFQDLGEAVVGIHAPTAAAIAITVVLLVLAVGAYATAYLRRARPTAGAGTSVRSWARAVGDSWATGSADAHSVHTVEEGAVGPPDRGSLRSWSPVGDRASRTLQLTPIPPPAGRRAVWPLLGFLAVYFLGLLVWPYESYRFGLPVLPVAAVGVALVASWLSRLRIVGTAIVVAALAAFTWWGGVWLASEAEADATDLAEVHAAMDDLATWIRQEVPPTDTLVSFDYREVARATDRTVLPLAYTSDMEALRDASIGEGADYLVVIRDLYPRRERLAYRLIAAYPDAFRIVYDRPRVEIYRIQP